MMMRKSVQVGLDARRRCPCFGVLCFLCAFIASLFGTKSAFALFEPGNLRAPIFEKTYTTNEAEPFEAMLDDFLAALPDLFAGTLLLVIAVVVAKIVGRFASGLLAGIGLGIYKDETFTET